MAYELMNLNHEARDSIAVLGGAVRFTETQIIAAFCVGRQIAARGFNLVTGGTTGIPYAAAAGAKLSGATVVGISPAASVEEHILRYKKPLDFADVIIYTGMGLEGRNPINVRSAKGAIFIGGEFGTMNEFSAAYTCGENVLGILEGMGGVSDCLRDLLIKMDSNYGSFVIFESDPVRLADSVCNEVRHRYSAKSMQLKSEELGSDVRNMLRRFLREENKRLCANPSANTLTGGLSTINLR